MQGEYVYRSKELEPAGIPQRAEFVSRQDGLYVQVVYGIAPRWTVAGRFDTTDDRDRTRALTGLDDIGSATRYATNVTFNPTEFSRLRLQYNNDSTDDRGRMHQLYVQFQMSLGAHGAHQF